MFIFNQNKVIRKEEMDYLIKLNKFISMFSKVTTREEFSSITFDDLSEVVKLTDELSIKYPFVHNISNEEIENMHSFWHLYHEAKDYIILLYKYKYSIYLN